MISTTGMPAESSLIRAASECSSPAMITPDGRHESILYSTFFLFGQIVRHAHHRLQFRILQYLADAG